MRTKEQSVALDIYSYIEKVFCPKTPEDLSFKINQGEHGCRNKVLSYIEEKYLKIK